MAKLVFIFGLVIILFVLSTVVSVGKPIFPDPPPGLEDPRLVDAWVQLYRQTETVNLWDGKSTSGKALALFVKDNAIRIQWDSQDICDGNSCSKIFCAETTCTHQGGEFHPNPIIITLNLEAKPGLDELVDTLAHEIFHYTDPFGMVDDTQYEEYWANYLGAVLSGKNLDGFKGINPLNPACLAAWLGRNNIAYAYKDLGAYPISMMAEVDHSESSCSREEETLNPPPPNDLNCIQGSNGIEDCDRKPIPISEPEYRLECKTDALGLVTCEKVITG